MKKAMLESLLTLSAPISQNGQTHSNNFVGLVLKGLKTDSITRVFP